MQQKKKVQETRRINEFREKCLNIYTLSVRRTKTFKS